MITAAPVCILFYFIHLLFSAESIIFLLLCEDDRDIIGLFVLPVRYCRQAALRRQNGVCYETIKADP